MNGLMDEPVQAQITFYGGLNAFLPSGKRQETLPVVFKGRPAVKHLIESLGIPHTEVRRIRVNGQSADLTYPVQAGDQIEVYPAVAVYDHPQVQTYGPLLEVEPRFILDNHLGRLAAYLRMLGFDSLYRNDYQDEELSQVASQEVRILLTRDRGLLMRRIVAYGYCVQTMEPPTQLVEILRRFDLLEQAHPFQRCLHCNTILQPVEKKAILERLEPLTRLYYDEFAMCPNCRQIYWKGSHYLRMQALIKEATKKTCQA